LFFQFGEIGLEPLGEFTTSEHHTPTASSTLEADVCAETRYGPFVGAARMLFAESQVVVEFEIRKHIVNQRNHYIACHGKHLTFVGIANES
jgi:hypothetical protein